MDYQSNRKKDKQPNTEHPDKDVKKVITGEVINRPKPLGSKFKGLFFGDDFKNVARYVADTVFMPALRDLFVDMMTQGARRMMYGDDRSRGRRYSEVRPSRVTYNNPINRSAQPADPRTYANLPDQHSPLYRGKANQQVILTSRADAELVLENLVEFINKYDVATVMDLKELIGHESDHTDNKWGWTFLTGVDIRQVRDGYLIDLPPAEAI